MRVWECVLTLRDECVVIILFFVFIYYFFWRARQTAIRLLSKNLFISDPGRFFFRSVSVDAHIRSLNIFMGIMLLTIGVGGGGDRARNSDKVCFGQMDFAKPIRTYILLRSISLYVCPNLWELKRRIESSQIALVKYK